MKSVFPKILIFYLSFFILPFFANAQMNADFTANVVSGCSPLVVQFTDISTGSPTTWNWNLGNGNNSSLQNPGATYITPGTYTVSLTVSNGGANDTETKTAYITVFANPVADFSVNTASGCLPLSVNFSDISTPGTGAINQWFWDFGDGSPPSNLQNPSHIYTSAGNFNVSLIVTDVNGCTKSITKPNFINAFNGPSANFSASPTSSCTIPFAVNFTNSSTGSGGLSYLWNFGDGNTSSSVNPSNSYNVSGSFTISLVVTDGGGCKDTMIQNNLIKILQANFSATPVSGCTPLTVNFSDSSTGSPTTWLWDFGDGITSAQQNPSHTYTASGTYTVTLTAGNGTCTDDEIKVNLITVSSMPTVSFTASDTVPCQIPATISFSDNTPGAVAWQWNFGDGGTSTAANPSHTYTGQGNYDVTLIVTVSNGCKDTLVKSSYVVLQKPQAIFSADTNRGCVPLTVEFTDSSVSGSPITNWSWNFGDGNTSSSQNPSHTFTDTGMYVVKLVITNDKGCVDSMSVFVFAGMKPDADFSGIPLSGCIPLSVSFTDLSSSFSNTWFWLFGDGGTDSTQNPTHIYSDTGTFDVTLIVSNYGCSDTLIIPDYVQVYPPKAIFNVLPGTIGCGLPFTISVEDQSIGADTWFWDFGNGTTFNGQNPSSFTYTSQGTFTIKLVVTNTNSGCADSTTQTIRISQPTVGFTFTGSGCQPLLVSFTDTSSSLFGMRNWVWDFGDSLILDNLAGQSGTSAVPPGTNNSLTTGTYQNPSHTYMNPGTYTVTLTVTDQLVCSGTITMTNIITVNQIPTVDITSDKQVGCPPFTVQFTDLTTGTVGIADWDWTFGDGTTDSVQNPVHTYTSGGTYTVTLIATDSNGCISGIVKNNHITVISPQAGFFSNTGVCVGISQLFTDTSTAANPVVSWFWDFGDGITDTVQNPIHTYANVGVYDITLAIADSAGCVDTIVKINYVTVQSPTANFGANPTTKNCPPLLVNFSDSSSSGIVSWNWLFGNGNSSTLQNPSHLYNAPGKYDVTLIVTTSLGCKDTIVKPELIKIDGPNGDLIFSPDSGCPGTIVNFDTANVQNAVSYSWDFGDGAIVTSVPPVNHQYLQVGVYHPFLTFIDSAGCSFGVQSPDSIQIVNIPVDAGNDVIICKGDSVALQASGGTSFAWTPSTGLSNAAVANPMASPSDTTKYFVSVTDTNGCNNIDSVMVFVKHNVPIANFSADTVCLNEFSAFTDLSTIPGDTIVSWNWNFGDNGAISADTNPNYIFSSGGNFNVFFTVTANNGCVDTVTKTVRVHPLPAANAGTDTSICIGKTTLLNATGAGISGTYSWLPTTNLNNPNIANPLASPTVSTQYFVTVTDSNSCVNTDTVTVLVNQLPDADAGNDLQICLGDSTVLNATGGISVAWNQHSTLSDTATNNPTAKPTDTTTYYVTVTDINGCINTDSVTITVNPNFPDANFSSSLLVCEGQSTAFADLSSMIGDTIISWQWNFGDANSDTAQNPTHTYSTPGSFSVTLLITTNQNCTDSVTKTVFVNPRPVPDFIVSDNCFGNTTSFTDASYIANGGNIVEYNWNFGDNSSGSTEKNPTHFYSSDSIYNVTLIVVSDSSCIDTVAQDVRIFPKPFADFIAEPVCLNESVQFTDLSKVENDTVVISSWNWNFGDGAGNSSLQNPAYTYAVATSYTATLIVETGGTGSNCRDTVSNTVTVYPLPEPQCSSDPAKTDIRTPEIKFMSGPANSYFWDFAGMDTSSQNNPSFTFQDTGTYTIVLTVTNEFDCPNDCEVEVRIDPYDILNVPNAFTPNADGPNGGDFSINPFNNNVFFPITKYVTEFQMQIFSRWGELLFVSDNPNVGWDGYYKGKLCAMDVYVWKIKVTFASGNTVTKAGDVTLIR